MISKPSRDHRLSNAKRKGKTRRRSSRLPVLMVLQILGLQLLLATNGNTQSPIATQSSAEAEASYELLRQLLGLPEEQQALQPQNKPEIEARETKSATVRKAKMATESSAKPMVATTKATAKVAQKATIEANAKVAPKATAKANAQVTPKAGPKVTPKVAPKTTAKTNAKVTPKTTPKANAKVAAKVEAQPPSPAAVDQAAALAIAVVPTVGNTAKEESEPLALASRTRAELTTKAGAAASKPASKAAHEPSLPARGTPRQASAAPHSPADSKQPSQTRPALRKPSLPRRPVPVPTEALPLRAPRPVVVSKPPAPNPVPSKAKPKPAPLTPAIHKPKLRPVRPSPLAALPKRAQPTTPTVQNPEPTVTERKKSKSPALPKLFAPGKR